MGPEDIRAARSSLGELWALGRPLKASELGRALKLGGRDPGRHILDMESGKHPVSGPIAVAIELMLAGGRPSHLPPLPTDGVVRKILERITPWAGSEIQALAWYRAEPLPPFGGRTAAELVREGKSEAVLQFLDHIERGGFA